MNVVEPRQKPVARTPLKRANRNARQQILAEFRAFASREIELEPVFEKAVFSVCGGLGTEFCKILKLSPDSKSFLLIAGCGWKSGLVGKAVTHATLSYQAGYTLKNNRTIILSDLDRETRFSRPPLLTDHNVRSGLSTPLQGEFGPWGVLGAHSRRGRKYSQSEIEFFESIADVLSNVIQRDLRAKAYADATERLQLALSTARIGTWTVDLKTSLSTRDAVLNEIHGLEPVDSTQPIDEYWAMVHPEDLALLRAHYDEIARTGKYSEAEFRIGRPDGVVRWVHARGKLARDGCLAGAMLDITERRKNEHELTRMAAIVDHSQDAILSESLDGIIVSWNRGAQKIFGYTEEEIIGQHVGVLLPPARSHELDVIFDRVRRGETVEPFETVRIRKDGGVIHVSSAVSPIRDASGKIMGISAIIRDITRRKHAENSLRESEERLRLALDAGKLGTWEWHINEGRVVWSEKLEELHGISKGSFQGTFDSFKEGIHPEDRTYVLDQINKALTSRAGFHIEYRLSNGKWVEGRGNVLLDESGNPERMAGVCADITRRKQAETALRESEQRFRQMADATPAMLWVSGQDRCCNYFNKAWLTFRGRQIDEELGHGWTEGVHPDDLKKCLELFEHAYDQQEAFQLNYRLLRHDGQYRSVFCSGVPRFDNNNILLGYVGSAIDITEIQKAERALREEAALKASETRFRESADAMAHIIWEWQPNGYFDYFNRRWHEYTGITDTGGTLEIWKPVFHPDDWETATQRWQSARDRGSACEGEFRLRDARSGDYRWHLGRTVPIRDATGAVVRFIGTATDIHDQKESQSALAQAQEDLRSHAAQLETAVQERTAELEESLKTTETLLYTIAHDLRAPLRAMQGMAIAVLDDYAFRLDEDGREYLDRIHTAARRMDQLIADLLAYGRLGHIEMPIHTLDLETEFKNILAELADELRQKKGEIALHGPMPKVRANPVALQQVISNLLTNAIKFVPAETPPRIDVSSARRDGMVRVTVQDNGIGIDPGHQDRIFQVFQRLHTQELYAGTGIGLAIVAKAIQRMNGTVGVDSKSGEGSCFWFELPAAD
jgi:PAS domain S-box-containing protein